MEFDQNVACAIQDDDSIIVAYQEGGLACYDWNKDKIIDEIKSIGPVKSLNISPKKLPNNDRVLVCGCANGEVVILRQNCK